ncbi:hypothetical protein ACHAPV_009039 [Trichoderma viride]
MGTGNAHHYHINGSAFKVLIGPLFEKFSANYEIYDLYGMPLNKVTVYRNAHAVYKYVEVVTWQNPTAASSPHLTGQPSSFRTLPRFLLILHNVPVGSQVEAALLSQSEGVGNVACWSGILPESRL